MKGFETDVLAVLQQTTTTTMTTTTTTTTKTPFSRVSTEHLEPEFALDLLDESETKTEVKNQRNNDYHLEDDGWEPDCERERAFIERSGREGATIC